ncbi:MAG: GNAT family N-acetyltransferase [Phycisphaerae bacterium]|nr:GNAT family N-acetyltransferase [Phycisphaerae bacterium]
MAGGVGRGLVETALSALRETGIGKCHIMVFADNRAGSAFWRRIGWSLRDDLRFMSKMIEEPMLGLA